MTLLSGNPHPEESTFCLLWLVVVKIAWKNYILCFYFWKLRKRFVFLWGNRD